MEAKGREFSDRFSERLQETSQSPRGASNAFLGPPLQSNSQSHQSTSNHSGSVGADAQHQYQALSDLIAKCDSGVVRQVLRDNWRKCLGGDDFHYGFLLNVALHEAGPNVISQAVQDSGSRLASFAKEHIMQNLTPQDLDQVSDIVLRKAGTRFLDLALARRFETIPARALVNALARAERLGYDINDVVDERPGVEQVTPAPLVAPAAARQPVEVAPMIPSAETLQREAMAAMQRQQAALGATAKLAKDNNVEICTICSRPCSSPKALDYHRKKAMCQSSRYWQTKSSSTETCTHCGVSFESKGGLTYHQKHAVCGTHSTEVEHLMQGLLNMDARKRVTSLGQQAVPKSGQGSPAPQFVQNQPTKTMNGSPAAHNQSTPISSNGAQKLVDSHRVESEASLSPELRKKLEKDLRDGEEKYGPLMRETLRMPESQRFVELGKLKNSYQTRQSTTRKKYGIRMRERRTVEEIHDERLRLMGSEEGATLLRSVPVGGMLKKPHPSSSQLSSSPSHGRQSPASRMTSSAASSPKRPANLDDADGRSTPTVPAEKTNLPFQPAPSQPSHKPATASVTMVDMGPSVSSTAPPARGTQAEPMEIDSQESSAVTSDKDKGTNDDLAMDGSGKADRNRSHEDVTNDDDASDDEDIPA